MLHVKLGHGAGSNAHLLETLTVAEAAVVAAGLPYRKVYSISDCPTDFSRTIGPYAIVLDYYMGTALRKELLGPFITRLPNSAIAPEIEVKRGRFIALETCRRIFSLFCDEVLRRPELAEQCRNAKDNREGSKICRALVRDLCPKFYSYPTCSPSRAESFDDRRRAAFRKADAVHHAGYACRLAAKRYEFETAVMCAALVIPHCCPPAAWVRRKRYFTAAVQILEEAIELGAGA